MLKSLLLLTCAVFVTAKLDKIPHLLSVEYESPKPKEVKDLKAELSEDLWVLKLDNGDSGLRLRAGNMAEDEEFEASFGDMIESFELTLTPRRIKKDNPEKEVLKTQDDETQMKMEIIRIINKFALYSQVDPDSNLYEIEREESSPLIALYFKGPYTSFRIKCGTITRQYFITPPSPLPSWFYEEHRDVIHNGQAIYVDVPKAVENKFYKALLHILETFLSCPF